jgi:hypothetical protein
MPDSPIGIGLLAILKAINEDWTAVAYFLGHLLVFFSGVALARKERIRVTVLLWRYSFAGCAFFPLLVDLLKGARLDVRPGGSDIREVVSFSAGAELSCSSSKGISSCVSDDCISADATTDEPFGRVVVSSALSAGTTWGLKSRTPTFFVWSLSICIGVIWVASLAIYLSLSRSLSTIGYR